MKRRHVHKSNVLLVNITRLGDMLQATPTIAGMKMENPDCKITVVVEKQFEGVCKIIPNIDQIQSIDLGMTVRSLAREGEGIIDAYEYVTEFVDDLRSKNFDYCLNMSSSAYTALLLNLVGIGRNGGWTADDEGYRVIESEWARLFATSVFHQNRQFNSLNLVDVFRCSADVDQHPRHLILNTPQKDLDYADTLIREARFTNSGPLIAIQAGASQQKRQWNPQNFVSLVNELTQRYNARVVMVGTKKELPIIEPIARANNSPNVCVAAGRTDVPQLGALLKRCNVLVTGDTGPMHISVAVGTPVVSMFLASAYGFETGPYSEGNIVLQPVIGCGPCNPNKPCARPDCHDHFSPEALAKLTALRVSGDVTSVPQELFDPAKVIVYRTCFDRFGFYDMQALNSNRFDQLVPYRAAYRRMWLDDLGGLAEQTERSAGLSVLKSELRGVDQVVQSAQEGAQLIKQLENCIRDVKTPPRILGELNERLSEVDRAIEEIGYHYSHLGPITRMFVFAKENLSGTDALQLASQMEDNYRDLERRSLKLASYFGS